MRRGQAGPQGKGGAITARGRARMARRGYLRSGKSFGWSWNRGGEPSGSIGVLVHGRDSLALQYMIGSEGERRDGTQTIRLAHTRCNYGKDRPWFVCPHCQRRAGLLFMRWGRFACRKCQRVAFTSQSEDLCGRTWRAQQKIEQRLGKNWRRPKGMRWTTYNRLIYRRSTCEETRDTALAGCLERLMASGA
jgi:hypothetical protein